MTVNESRKVFVNFNNLLIRPMIIDDLPKILEIENINNDISWPKEIFHECIMVGFECYVLQIRNQLIAYAIMSVRDKQAKLLNISVLPTYQGHGYSWYLMIHMLDIAKQKKTSNVFLKVRKNNTRALKFYQKLNFRLIEKLSGYYEVKDGHEDALVLTLEL